MEIDGEITFNEKAYPACLYHKDDDPSGLIITGFGKTDTGEFATKLDTYFYTQRIKLESLS